MNSKTSCTKWRPFRLRIDMFNSWIFPGVLLHFARSCRSKDHGEQCMNHDIPVQQPGVPAKTCTKTCSTDGCNHTTGLSKPSLQTMLLVIGAAVTSVMLYPWSILDEKLQDLHSQWSTTLDFISSHPSVSSQFYGNMCIVMPVLLNSVEELIAQNNCNFVCHVTNVLHLKLDRTCWYCRNTLHVVSFRSDLIICMLTCMGQSITPFTMTQCWMIRILLFSIITSLYLQAT